MGMLDEKVAVVTNGGQGVGRETALLMAHEGARVVVHDSEAVVQEIRERGGEAAACMASVMSMGGSNRLTQTALDAFGRLDILVNGPHAGAGLRRPTISEIGEEEWASVQRATLKAAFLCTRAALPHMRKQRHGRLIHFVSSEALAGNVGYTHHGALQVGVAGLSRNAAIEVERYHVTSNCIVPFSGPRAVLDPADVAPLAVFLASDAAHGLSGQMLGVRGKEIFLLSQPRIQRSMHNSQGWTVERLSETFESTMGPYFTPLEPWECKG